MCWLGIFGPLRLLAASGSRPGGGLPICRPECGSACASVAGELLLGWERLLAERVGAQSAEYRPYTLEHGHMSPCAELFDAPLAFLFCRPQGARYGFRPTFHRRRTLVLIATLLLRSGIESNPGPSSHKRLQLSMGLINAQSIVNKAAHVHDLIADNHLDLLAVTETWVYEDSPNVHKREAAPNGYSVVHAHRRLAGAGGVKKCGGGVALIHRSNIRVTIVPIRPATKSFELLLAKVANCALGLTIAIVYRAPGTSAGEFGTELSDLVDSGRLGLRYIIAVI